MIEPETTLDAERILRALAEHEVDYVLIGDIDIPVVDLDDLIRMKLARGRPVDLADVASLTDPDATP